MTDYVLVEYGDLTGGGFVPNVGDGRAAPPAAYTAVATKLLTNVPQRDEPAEDGHLLPMWSLRQVGIDSVPHWCFAVQGRGGAFGQAGMCQFLFAPASHDPAQFWHWAVCRVGADGLLGHPDTAEPSDRWLRPVARTALSAALTALFADAQAVVVDGEPVDVAATLNAVIALLPTAEVRRHVFSTYLVRRAVRDTSPPVTGRWPQRLPGGNAGLGSWLDRAAEQHGKRAVKHPKTAEVVAWLTALATRGEALPQRYLEVPSLAGLVDLVAARELDFEESDVPVLLAAGDARLTTGHGRGVLSRWAADAPAAAIAELAGPKSLPVELTEVLFDSILDVHVGAAPHTNPALFPPAADQVPGWSTTLARLLRARFDSRARMAEFVRDYVIADGRPLHGADLHQVHEPWLAELGVSPADPSVGIYGVPTARIVADIRQHKALSPTARAFLDAAPDTWREVEAVLDGLGTVTPTVAVELMRLCAGREGEVLARVLDLGRGQGPAWAEKWLLTAHNLAGPSLGGTVLAAGVAHFDRLDRQLPTGLLVQALRSDFDRLTPPAQRKVLRDAAVRLESDVHRTAANRAAHAVPQPEPATREPEPGSREDSTGSLPDWHQEDGAAERPAKRGLLSGLPSWLKWPDVRWLLIALVVVGGIAALYLIIDGLFDRSPTPERTP
ncbi:hypothetical protein ABZ816_34130 [Actinosynnema sp. NPDC047251]|uniref:Putative membrane protein n=1 Tax=Saccharothrix espanaensis (strain ATCC 51144 / DSM 44229 / JCM 9112 / NBRC 15066 / NRRL 15764) TaxID=1179773 RepID=K0K5V6_SACES|nr:hypothetical protein [Saccharothrix espanaensis]CCH32259.1 putative membrane protein [Saccharothrix espanaensis DSM 44229]